MGLEAKTYCPFSTFGIDSLSTPLRNALAEHVKLSMPKPGKEDVGCACKSATNKMTLANLRAHAMKLAGDTSRKADSDNDDDETERATVHAALYQFICSETQAGQGSAAASSTAAVPIDFAQSVSWPPVLKLFVGTDNTARDMFDSKGKIEKVLSRVSQASHSIPSWGPAQDVTDSSAFDGE